MESKGKEVEYLNNDQRLRSLSCNNAIHRNINPYLRGCYLYIFIFPMTLFRVPVLSLNYRLHYAPILTV